MKLKDDDRPHDDGHGDGDDDAENDDVDAEADCEFWWQYNREGGHCKFVSQRNAS